MINAQLSQVMQICEWICVFSADFFLFHTDRMSEMSDCAQSKMEQIEILK